MKIDIPTLLSQITNFIVLLTPILLLVLLFLSHVRRMQRIEDKLSELVEAVKKLAEPD